MTSKDTLLEKLRAEKTAKEEEGNIDWNVVQSDWLSALKDLMAKFRSWMKPAVKEALLDIEDVEYSLSEDYIGHYSATGLTIKTPSGRRVDVQPFGRLVLGAHGRVDLLSGPNKATLLKKESGDWVFMITGGPNPKYAPLTEETFNKTLADILN